jgi:hypothetical protein
VDEDAEAAAEADVAALDGVDGELDDDDDEQPAASAAQASAMTRRPAPASGTVAVTRPTVGIPFVERPALRNTFCLHFAAPRAPYGAVCLRAALLWRQETGVAVSGFQTFRKSHVVHVHDRR